MIMDNVHYDIRWSDRLDERFIDDYIALQTEIFLFGDCGCDTAVRILKQTPLA